MSDVRTYLADGVYHLDARIAYRLSDEALEALHRGVPLTLVLDIEVWRKRKYWLNVKVAELEQRYELSYHALSDQYIAVNLNTGIRSNFTSLATALTELGTVSELPVLDRQVLDPNENYAVRIRARLDLDALPTPLRVMAYVWPAWHLSSDWYQWPLKM